MTVPENLSDEQTTRLKNIEKKNSRKRPAMS